MTRPRTLARLLARQWMAYTLALCALFLGATVLLLYILEDSFLDRRLRSVASTVAARPTERRLPPAFAAWPIEQAPGDLRARFEGRGDGALAEFRRSNGRYVHAMRIRGADGRAYVVAFDATDELTVNPGLGRGIGYATALTGLLLLCAALLARAFMQRIERAARDVVADALRSPDPEALRRLAASQRIREFGTLIAMQADAWQAQRTAVESEREMLAYLGHELRTPLQSARTSLALLRERSDDAAALGRLERAVSRLARASAAVLWLAARDTPAGAERTRLAPCVAALLQELGPLAEARGQRLRARVPPSLAVSAPAEAVEAILANLLANAIRHGAAGPITVAANDRELRVRNRSGGHGAGGFGMGLRLVERIATRLRWSVDVRHAADRTLATVRWCPTSSADAEVHD